jgi:hypothetical protein
MPLEEDHIHWFNFPLMESKANSLDSIHVRKALRFTNKKTPVIINMLNGNMRILYKMKHKDVGYLNEVGIDIYLYEPLVSYYQGSHNQQNNPQFYYEFLGNEDPALIRAKELDSIQEYIKQNGLTNVTVHTCDYDVEKYYPHYKTMKLITDDLFIKSQAIVNRPLPPPINKIERKFISLNWRYTTHRHIIAAYLKFTNSVFLSWKYQCNFETFSKNVWFDIESWRKTNMKQYTKLKIGMLRLDKESPLTLDTRESPVHINTWDHYNGYPITNHAPELLTFLNTCTNDVISNVYSKAFVAVVNESRFAQPTGNYSEKVIQAILHKLPFIIVAPPYTLKYMREMGFKTFGEFWDESYDEITCNSTRMIKILELIDHINSKSIEELELIKDKMQHILKYNYTIVNMFSHNLYTSKLQVK